MTRFAFLAGLLLLLAAAAPATARPAYRASWPFWLSKPERHGSRKLAGDYTHHYGTYRNHSRPDGGGLFGFLHGNGRATARHKGPMRAHKSSRRRTTGLF
ncbi:hypothetical protein [Hymenobacter cheonanensis]|uniref:hypothetical protein n=1 Tax=Hymenobacter sp. CA2-7 TaxID=3063993 RepID=UPI002712C2C4|nr:hypothetical protein [Hymenobacter sp. CA2-7]MDO7886729.1 hypothetical protein [Hymenobacter sp. CA2-7]